jgi:hypothetical protein
VVAGWGCPQQGRESGGDVREDADARRGEGAAAVQLRRRGRDDGEEGLQTPTAAASYDDDIARGRWLARQGALWKC